MPYPYVPNDNRLEQYERMWELVEQERRNWSRTIDILGGPGHVPIRYLINLPEYTPSEKPKTKK